MDILMHAFLNFFEDYITPINAIALDLQAQKQGTTFSGITSRRSTAFEKIDKTLTLKQVDWIGDLEQDWLTRDVSDEDYAFYRSLLGDVKLKHLIACDRDIGRGWMFGGIYARSKLSEVIGNNDTMRWRYVINLCRYYHDRFTHEKPDIVFFNEYTMAYELGAYYVASALQIPALCLMFSRMDGGFQVVNNPYNIFTLSDAKYNKYLDGVHHPSAASMERATKYVDNFLDNPTLPQYSQHFKDKAIKDARLFSGLKMLLKNTIKMVAIALRLRGTKGFLRQRYGMDILMQDLQAWLSLRKTLRGQGGFYEGAPESEKYVYFPLHVEPEASLSVFNTQNTNQLHIIEQISKAIPVGHTLYVKEHIPVLGSRPKGFYDAINAMPDVKLINPFMDNLFITKHADTVITLSGTVGWEAIMFQRPTVVIGQAQYKSIAQGFVNCNNLNDLKHAMSVAKETQMVDRGEIAAYLACLFDNVIDLPYLYYNQAHISNISIDWTEQDVQEGIKKLTEQIIHFANINSAAQP